MSVTALDCSVQNLVSISATFLLMADICSTTVFVHCAAPWRTATPTVVRWSSPAQFLVILHSSVVTSSVEVRHCSFFQLHELLLFDPESCSRSPYNYCCSRAKHCMMRSVYSSTWVRSFSKSSLEMKGAISLSVQLHLYWYQACMQHSRLVVWRCLECPIPHKVVSHM